MLHAPAIPGLRLGLPDIAMGVGVALTWGMGFVFAKAAMGHFPPILLMALRFGVAALVLVWFARPPRGQIGALALIALIGSAIQYSLTFTGMKGLDAGVVALVVQLEVPFLVLIGAVFLGERPGWRKWAGIALAFLGVWQITGEPRIAAAWGSVLMVLAGAMFWAVGQAMVRQLSEISGLTLTAWVATLAAPQLLVSSLIFEHDHWQVIRTAGPMVWAAVLYLGLVMTALGYWLWYTLVRRNPVSSVAPFLLLMPVFAVAGGVVVLGEPLGLATLRGGALVIAGLGLILIGRG